MYLCFYISANCFWKFLENNVLKDIKIIFISSEKLTSKKDEISYTHQQYIDKSNNGQIHNHSK